MPSHRASARFSKLIYRQQVVAMTCQRLLPCRLPRPLTLLSTGYSLCKGKGGRQNQNSLKGFTPRCRAAPPSKWLFGFETGDRTALFALSSNHPSSERCVWLMFGRVFELLGCLGLCLYVAQTCTGFLQV